MKNIVVLFFIGLASVALHLAAPTLIPYSLDMFIGAGLMAVTAFVFLRWVITENRARPAIERLEPNEEDLRNATPEILYLIEDGWGIKKIVDMISANYQLPPKMVYAHVMELMSSRQQSLEFAQSNQEQKGNSLHMGRVKDGQQHRIEIYHSPTDEE